jgi:hypothetical protein
VDQAQAALLGDHAADRVITQGHRPSPIPGQARHMVVDVHAFRPTDISSPGTAAETSDRASGRTDQAAAAPVSAAPRPHAPDACWLPRHAPDAPVHRRCHARDASARLVAGHATHEHCIDLDRVQDCISGGGESLEDVGESVAAGDCCVGGVTRSQRQNFSGRRLTPTRSRPAHGESHHSSTPPAQHGCPCGIADQGAPAHQLIATCLFAVHPAES